MVPDAICLDALDDQADAAVSDERLLVAGVADKARPAGGDTLACFGFAADGTRLEGRVKPAETQTIRLRSDGEFSARRGRRIGGRSLRPPLSGSSCRPVGPIWISVPISGQTPQS